MNSDYIELRARSAFSFLEGATTPEDLAARAAELGYRAMALGDRDGLYGAPRFYQAAKSAGIRQIAAAELTLDDDSRLYVLAPDRTRYQNLCRMITAAKMRVLNPGASAPDGSAVEPVYPAKGESRITLDDLERYGHGLICLAGGVKSPLSRMIVRGEDPIDLCRRLGAIFGAGNFYIDLQRHLDAGEERLNRKLAALADAARIPVVATNDVCHGGSDRSLLDVLTCIRLKTTLEEAGRALWINSQRHLKSPAEMAALFRDLPGAVATSRAIAERCAFHAVRHGLSLPRLPASTGRNGRRLFANTHLRGRARAMARRDRRPHAPPARTRARDHRAAQARRLLPDRMGHRAVLPRESDHGAGARLRGQQRGVLRARNHGGGCGQDGAAVRALPFRGARRMARHRPRPAQRRRSRAGDSIRLSPLRRTRRRDDRQRDHLSNEKRGARSRQGAGLFARTG